VSKPGAGWTKEWMDEIREKVVAELQHKAALEQEKAAERAADEILQEEAAAAGVPYVPLKKRQHCGVVAAFMTPDEKKDFQVKLYFLL
jgi:peptidyl-tRNA hydrolase